MTTHPSTTPARSREIQRERDHLLMLHEALVEVESASGPHARLRVFADAIQRLGFGRVIITLRDEELNVTDLVAAGLTRDEERSLRESPAPGSVWQRRLQAIERFRVSDSYYLDGRDPLVAAEFADRIPSRLSPEDADGDWSPNDVLLVPLRARDGPIVGLVLLDDPVERARPSLTRVRTVELFGRQVLAMLQQDALHQLAERRAARLQTLNDVGALLTRTLDERTIVQTLARQVQRLLGATSVVVHSSVEASADELVAQAALMRRVARAARRLAVPVALGGSVIAVIVVETDPRTELKDDDVELLDTVAAQAATALSNARIYAESQRQRRQTEALSEVARAVSESLQLDRVVQLILRHATALLHTEGATLSLLRGDGLDVVAAIGSGEPLLGLRLPLHGSLTGRAVRQGDSILGDVSRDRETYAGSVEAAGVQNVGIVPLSSVNGPIGALSVFNRSVPFTPEDAEVLQRLADQVAMAVVNARLFEEVGEATREWAVAFDAIGSGMVLLDVEGRIQRSNARARELMHVKREEELLGRTLHEALFGEPDPCIDCLHMAAISTDEVLRGSHSARGRIFELTAAPHPLGGAVVTFDDVTEHRALGERYRLVVETSSDAIVIVDRERRISFANPAALALLGPNSHVIGTPLTRFIPDGMRDHVGELEERALGGDAQQFETVVLRADGERRLVAATTAPLRSSDEVTGVVASLRDITEERRARDAVSLSEARYRNLFDSAADAIYTLDANGAFTSVNEATVEMTGYARSDLLGHGASRLVLPEELPYVAEQLFRAREGESVRYECRFRRADGQIRLVSVHNTAIRRGSEVTGVLAIARDVTEERERIAALERSEARYTRLVESASDAIFTVDEQGRFTAVNRALEESVGRPRAELVGQVFSDLVDRRDLASAEQLLRDTFAGERRRGALRYRAADGDVREGSLITSPVLENGAVVGVLGIMRDVTDERRLAEQMMQQEKLAAVGQLVSGVAHELNNPLAGVMAFAELLLSHPVAGSDARYAAETIHHEAQRAAKIVKHLLTFARQQPSERVATDLNAVVDDSVALRQYALRTGEITLVMDLDPELPLTWADPFQLQQVVLNLLGNAEQAVLEQPHDRKIVVRTWRTSTEIGVTVSDSGPGIPAERLGRIFNPFYTTKPVGQGTGLGLSISDGIVREHGGRLRVESQPGEGATFVLELPLVEPPDRPAGAERRAIRPAPDARRVLVVDDEAAMRSAMSSFLLSIGHAVDVAASAAEARALLLANEYDVVLLDLRMPGTGGDALYRELVARDPRHAARVVFVTGDVQSAATREFLSGTGRPIVGKPFQLDDLAAIITSVLT